VIDLAVEITATLGEGPVWDSRTGELLWVDIAEGAIARYVPATGRTSRLELGENVGCIALTQLVGTVVGALRSGWYWVDLETGARDLIASLPNGGPTHRFNDGAVDAGGRFWTGTLENSEETPVGQLCRLGSDLQPRVVDRGFLCSNGIAWSLDERWMYFVDSRRDAIYRYEYDQASGDVGARELFIDTSPFRGIPDGIEVDLDGLLWCAFWDGAQVVAFDRDGTPRAEIAVPAPRPTSVTFGGPELRTLYITTATFGLSNDAIGQYPRAGSIFQIERQTPGRPANIFDAAPWAR
jgi:sugar lactone lactonase YvrE